MTSLYARILRPTAERCLRRATVSGSLLALSAALVALDHRWTELTWGAMALAAGVLLTKGK